MFRISWIIWFQLANVRGARQFPALWHFAEGLFILNYFIQKEGFLIKM